MKKKKSWLYYALLMLAAAYLLTWAFIPLPFFNTLPDGRVVTGKYNAWSGLIWCTSELSCIHEVGHKLDDMAGWPSRSAEYKQAIGPTVWNEEETYAEVFAFYGGKKENMPAHLAIFYNWELAEKLLEKYDGRY